MSETLKQKIVVQAIAKHTKDGKLTVSKMTIARYIMAKNSGLFASLDTARGAVRYYTGSRGDKDRGHIEGKGYSEVGISTIHDGIKKALFKSYSKNKKPFVLPPGKYGVMTDIHIPFQINSTIEAALIKFKEENVDGIILNGDIMDCYDLSRYDKGMGRPRISEELQLTRRFLDYLRTLFPTQPILYKFGNHEERMEHYVLKNARELGDLPQYTLEYLLNFEDLNITKIGREIIKLGKFNLLHGHEFGGAVNQQVNPARGLYTKIKASGGIGHHHQKSLHSESDINGNQHVTHSFGCMCNMEPEYMAYGYLKWTQGFAMIECFKDRTYKVNSYEVINGEVY